MDDVEPGREAGEVKGGGVVASDGLLGLATGTPPSQAASSREQAKSRGVIRRRTRTTVPHADPLAPDGHPARLR